MFLLLLWIILASVPAGARELYPGQYAQVAPEIRDWFRAQKSPRDGLFCCSEADGVTVEEDVRGGHFWVKGGPFPDWFQVPDDVVIHGPNKNGAPVVWTGHANDKPWIRCFAPGAGI
jgi:hypothetical protein